MRTDLVIDALELAHGDAILQVVAAYITPMPAARASGVGVRDDVADELGAPVEDRHLQCVHHQIGGH